MTAPAPLYVFTAGRSRHSGGRWHRDGACAFLLAPRRRQRTTRTAAEALGYHECPYCCPPPPCCVAGEHAATALTPAVPLAPADVPEWEEELAAEAALEGEP